MSNHKCLTNHQPNYEVKQRYIPTFVHEQIFDEAPLRPYTSKCTPTFHSTVFDTEGYNIKTVHTRNQGAATNTRVQPEKVIYSNNTQQKRIEDVSSPHKVFHASRNDWFDHTKQEIFSSMKNGQNRGYSRERKHVDLSSNPVFTDFVYETRPGIPTTKLQHVGPSLTVTQPVDRREQHQLHNALVQKTNEVVIDPRDTHQQQNVPVHVVNETQAQQESIKSRETINHKKTQKKFHQEYIPQNQRQLKLKGKKIATKPQTAQKQRVIQQKPTFTVIRKSRVHS